MSDFVKKAKLTELENKISNISNLATKTVLTTIENKIPSVNNLVNKTDYNTKVTEIENKLNNHNYEKYITTPEFNKLAADVSNSRIAQAKLITKTEFDSKLSNLNRKITSNKTKHLLVENELKTLKTFDLSYFIVKSHFDEDGTQNCSVFQTVSRYFKTVSASDSNILSWKSKGLSDENIKPPTTSNKTLNPSLCWNNDKCWCECKVLVDKGVCDKGYGWNPSNCECECEKSCDIGEYLDYENCKCRKRL